MNKYRHFNKFIFIFLLFLISDAYAQPSTGTVTPPPPPPPELTQEQEDWDEIKLLSVDRLTALRLAKKDSKFDYLRDEIDNQQATLEIRKKNETRRIRLGRGNATHIYPCYIKKRVEQYKK